MSLDKDSNELIFQIQMEMIAHVVVQLFIFLLIFSLGGKILSHICKYEIVMMAAARNIAYLGEKTQKTKDLKKSGILLSDKPINCLMCFELFCLPNFLHIPCPNPGEMS